MVSPYRSMWGNYWRSAQAATTDQIFCTRRTLDRNVNTMRQDISYLKTSRNIMCMVKSGELELVKYNITAGSGTLP
jgi:hypothetical protein